MPENGQNTDDVYKRVHSAILDGQLAPGAVMSQVALAEELGISRTPLREAPRMLQSEGRIEGEPRRVRVTPMTASDLEELYVMRVTLEAEALRLSVPNMASEDVARLEGNMAEMAHYAHEKDYGRWTVPRHQFHRALTARAGERVNLVLARTGLEVSELLEPAYDPQLLKSAVLDAGGELPKRRSRRSSK